MHHPCCPSFKDHSGETQPLSATVLEVQTQGYLDLTDEVSPRNHYRTRIHLFFLKWPHPLVFLSPLFLSCFQLLLYVYFFKFCIICSIYLCKSVFTKIKKKLQQIAAQRNFVQQFCMKATLKKIKLNFTELEKKVNTAQTATPNMFLFEFCAAVAEF